MNTRDYEIIRLTFDKHVARINLLNFFPEVFPMKSQTYRMYSQAFYEEIAITHNIEARVAQNFRERFIVTKEDIYNVFEMYCKEDYVTQFEGTIKEMITHQQFLELFVICLKNDSFKVAILIYSLYIDPIVDFDQKMMEILIDTMRNSTKFHEIKLFLLHQHFDQMSILQMNNIVDFYNNMAQPKDPKLNPLVSQYNTIKVSLLIYRLCWRIEQKQIYSLATKCQLLSKYIMTSIQKYFEKQNNIQVLMKYMSEPILHMTEKKDCLDIMLEMDMQELLKHPVVIEVLNLVYEGKYSISSTALSMSQTVQAMLAMDVWSGKSINERLINNITQFGDSASTKQTSLQYNIWKQSIQQREQDEMIFTVLFNSLLIFLCLAINFEFNISFEWVVQQLGGYFGKGEYHLFLNAPPNVQERFCINYIDQLDREYAMSNILYFLLMFNVVGIASSIFQKLAILKVKDNVELNFWILLLELSFIFVGVSFSQLFNITEYSTIVTDVCGKFRKLEDSHKIQIDKMYTMVNPINDKNFSFNFLISCVIIQSSMLCIIMLQRTQYLGELIIMLYQMINEFLRFFGTFGLVILMFWLIGRILGADFKVTDSSFFEVFLDLFNAINGNPLFEKYKIPVGQIYIAIFMYIFKVLLMSLLASMFINKYKQVWKNLDAYRLLKIIRLKNSVAYDKYIGGATLSFFPINVIVTPFIIPIMNMRSQRASDFLLKIQYILMILMYLVLAFCMIAPMVPVLYCKIMVNSVYILFNRTNQEYRGENIVQFLLSLVVGPLIICLSIIVDFLTIPGILLKDSKNFERKYQLNSDRFNDYQIDMFMDLFKRLFYGQGWQSWKGKSMTMNELMVLHRTVFDIVNNMHDLMCRGSKDYRQSLQNVQDYNMTKILTAKCAIPSKSGEFKEGRVEFDIVQAVAMDVEVYNFVDIVLRKYRMGKLWDEMLKKEKNKSDRVNDDAAVDGDDENGDEQQEIIKSADEEEDDETKKVDGIWPIKIGPDGIPLKRNPSDVMTNFYISYVVRAFTDLDDILQDLNNNGEQRRIQRFAKELKLRKETWDNEVVQAFNDRVVIYNDFIRKDLDMIYNDGANLQKQGEGSSKQKSSTDSTHSADDADGHQAQRKH